MNRSPKILIVEDSPTQALRLKLVFEAQQWQASCVGSADEALEEIDREIPTAMVVDYFLPGISGADLCRRVRMNINTRSIPIVMLTADEDEATEVRGLESGADDFFKKSADAEVLVLRMRSMLERERNRPSAPLVADAPFKRASILAVDDSQTYLSHLVALLKNEGYRIDAVQDPFRALQLLETSSYDLALVDLVMPGLDGIELCRRIIGTREQLDNPIAVLMLTGREAKEDLTRALEAGADDFVGKSSDTAVLKGRIRALLRRKFFQEENQRILEELKNKELEAVRARAEKEAALARAADERRQHAEAVAIELQQAKDQLECSNDELMRSNEELQQFAFVASHDLQEPLRSIASFCDLLQEEFQDKLGDDGVEYIQRIVAGASRMKALVIDLLTYSRVQCGENRFDVVDVGDSLRDALANLSQAIESSGAVVQAQGLPRVVGDRVQLAQLLQNLIGNAVLYRGPDPPQIRIESVQRSNFWEISVADNGIGIAPEHFERIFEIFKRLHARTAYPGTGIGLAVCRKIVERHGGRIWVESQPGLGSTFRFTLAAWELLEKEHEQNANLATV